MAPSFGTSGLRGLVAEMTPDLVSAHVHAFIAACAIGNGIFIGRDLRESSPALARIVASAAVERGVSVTDCGAVPTPALALAAMRAGAAAIMVTGSHIPADRNGLKFYTPQGELTKAGEAAIAGALSGGLAASPGPSGTIETCDAGAPYRERYRRAWGPAALSGRRIGIYAHSSVARDLLDEILTGLGAETVEFGRSTQFVPVDTEAVSAQTRGLLQGWAADGGLDAIVSTDGDGDRPLMTDETGRVIPGDILGQITAAALGAQIVVTPVSSNTGVEASGRFAKVIRTRIGSPYVIAAMEAERDAGGAPPPRIVGYEANGGFLLGFDAMTPGGTLDALMTRDSLLPLIAPLVQAGDAGLAALVAAQPPRFTASDRLQDIPPARALALIARLQGEATARDAFLTAFDARLDRADTTDGLRLHLDRGRIVHLRPSGNAPELRVYAEAPSADMAGSLLATGLDLLRGELA